MLIDDQHIRRVAFVVTDEATWTLPLYELAITTARRSWSLGIRDVRYWFVTPEPVPPAGVSARLEPEGITFIGSTFADLRPGAVLLDPRGEVLEVDRVVTCHDLHERNHHEDRRHRRQRASRQQRRAPVGSARA
jgi:hypothetical protein